MIITCKACNTSFNLDDKMLKPTGSKVRCSVCSKVFTAFPQQAPTPEPTSETVDSEKDAHTEEIGTPLAGGADLDFGHDDDMSTSDIDDAVSDALNADLSDTTDDSGATVIANLDDDLDLDSDELDLSLGGQTEVEETVIADLDMEDFDLDAPSAMDGDPDGSETIIANLDDDELDLDSDFSMEPVGAAESEASAADISPGTMDDIDDLDLTLELGGEDAGESVSSADSPGLQDDLDLSSLESLLQDDDDSDDDAVTMVVDSDEEPELALDMDDEAPIAKADGEADASPGELELDLDGNGIVEDLDLDANDGADQEVDLSEIEKMLEDAEPESAKFSSVPEQDLDLNIEASLDTEKWMSESGDEEQLVVDDELDLSEIEQVLDDVDTNAPVDTSEDPELQLDLDLGDDDALGAPVETVAADEELDFDLSDFEDVTTPPSDVEAAASEPADMELEFEVEEASQEEPSFEDSGLEETVAMAEPKAANTVATMSKPAVTTAATPPPAPVKKGMSKALIFLLILAILGGAGYGTYYLLEKNGIEIPFLSDYLKPKVQDPGNLKLTTYDINSRFIDNTNVGKLFVISGQVKNGYSNNRGMVTLMGSIFSANKTLVQQEKVYGGNVMSDLELSNLDWDQIKARQSNRLGDNRSNVKIEPEASIPFMVVFSDLPEDLEEFTIEVTGSTSLK